VLVIVVAVLGGKHHEVANLVNVSWCTVFIGMICLADFSCEEVVLSLLDVKCDSGHNLMSCGLFCVSICAEWH
jgi:hypothetical protein